MPRLKHSLVTLYSARTADRFIVGDTIENTDDVVLGARESREMTNAEREARIQGHILRVRSDPRWIGDDVDAAERGRENGHLGGRPRKLAWAPLRKRVVEVAGEYESETNPNKRGHIAERLARELGVHKRYIINVLNDYARRRRLVRA